MSIFRLSFASLLILVGCRGFDRSASLKDAVGHGAGNFPAAQCSNGEAANTFILVATDDLPPRQSWNVPKPIDPAQEPIEHSASQDINIRLNVCDADGDVVIERVDFINTFGFDMIQNVAASSVRGLEEALFDNDTVGLEIIIPFETYRQSFEETSRPTKEGVMIRGIGNGAVFATFVEKEPQGWVLSDRFLADLVFGKLEFGDFSTNPCPGSVLIDGRYDLGSATFEWWGCFVAGTSGGASPILKKLRITDRSRHLGDAFRGVPVDVVIAELPEGAYVFHGAHHKVCESQRLDLGHVIYSWTSDANGSGGGHCAAVPGVEGRLPRPDPDNGGVVYRHEYPSASQKEEGVTRSQCGHPLGLGGRCAAGAE